MDVTTIADKFNAAKFEAVKGKRFTGNGNIFISVEAPAISFSGTAHKMRDALANELAELGIINEKDKAQVTVSRDNSSIDVLATVINQDNLDQLITQRDGFVARRIQEVAASRIRKNIDGMEKTIETPAQRLLFVQKLLGANSPAQAMANLGDLSAHVNANAILQKEFDSLLVGYEAKVGAGR